MNRSWLFWHIIDVLRSEADRRPERDVYCPLWLATGLGAAGFVFLLALIVAALL